MPFTVLFGCRDMSAASGTRTFAVWCCAMLNPPPPPSAVNRKATAALPPSSSSDSVSPPTWVFLFFLARALWRLYIIPLKSSKTHASASNHLLHLMRTKSVPSRLKQANPFRFRNVSLNVLIDWPCFWRNVSIFVFLQATSMLAFGFRQEEFTCRTWPIES